MPEEITHIDDGEVPETRACCCSLMSTLHIVRQYANGTSRGGIESEKGLYEKATYQALSATTDA